MLRRINVGIVLSLVVLLTSLQLSYAGYDDFTVNVPNAQGGYTAIVIKKSGDGHVGPQGEYYSQFPTVAQLQVMYGLTSPDPTVVPVTYVQPRVQTEVSYQVINQVPYEERDEDYIDRSVIRPNFTEEVSHSRPKEDENNWTFFEFKKKKKSKQDRPDNQNTTKAANPSVDSKLQRQNQSQETNNSPKGLNKGPLPQKQKADYKVSQGQQGQPSKGMPSTAQGDDTKTKDTQHH